MLIGYAQVSKADGSRVLDLQIDALLAAGVDRQSIYADRISGRKDQRPGLDACLAAPLWSGSWIGSGATLAPGVDH